MIYINEQDAEVTDFLLIREDNSEWREPLVEVENEKINTRTN